MAFLAVDLYSRACLLLVEIEAGKLAVAGEFAYIVINAVVYLVSVTLVDKLLNVSYRFGDMIGNLLYDLGSADIELFEIFKNTLA